MNHLEDLVCEWFEYRGYFVRRNVLVGPRDNGGYECELDVVAYNPVEQHLVHVEPSFDSHSWSDREKRFAKKFEAGRRFIPDLFEGIDNLPKSQHIGVLAYASDLTVAEIDGGTLVHASQLYWEILRTLKGRPVQSRAVSEQFPLLRTLQQSYHFCWKEHAQVPVAPATGSVVFTLDTRPKKGSARDRATVHAH